MEANKMFHQLILTIEGGKLTNRTPNKREAQDFLNKAQREIIKERYAKWKNRPQLGYGDSNVRNAELAGIITATSRIVPSKYIQGTADNGALPNPDRDSGVSYDPTTDIVSYNDSKYFGVFVPLPNEAMYVLYESGTTFSIINNQNVTQWNVPVREITYDQYLSDIYNYYKYPYSDLIWSMDWGSFTTSTLSDGNYTNSSKSYSQEDGDYNMKGYAPITVGGIYLTPNAGETVIGNYYQLRIVGANAKITYNGIEYNSSYNNTIIKATSELKYTIAGQGTEQMRDITSTINTQRSKYILTGKGWYLKEYSFHYIKNPSDIEIDLITPALQKNCELADFLHDEIIQKAATLFAASIIPETNKYEVNSMQESKQQ